MGDCHTERSLSLVLIVALGLMLPSAAQGIERSSGNFCCAALHISNRRMYCDNGVGSWNEIKQTKSKNKCVFSLK